MISSLPAIEPGPNDTFSANLCCDDAVVSPCADHVHIACPIHAVFIIRRDECLSAHWKVFRH